MYESNIVCQFFREWGYQDGLKDATNRLNGKSQAISLLGNMQNPFDAFFGDVAVQDGSRFQLIEFKQDRKSFRAEVTTGKSNRFALFEHLKSDPDCQKLSYQGHVAGYVENNVLRLDPYYLTAKGSAASEFSDKEESMYFHDFNSYYKLWNGQSGVVEGQFGLDATDFKTYVECMYQHVGTDKNGVLLIYRKVKKENTDKNNSGTNREAKYELIPVYGSIADMIKKLRNAFSTLKAVSTTEEQDLDFFKDNPPSTPPQYANAGQNKMAPRFGKK